MSKAEAISFNTTKNISLCRHLLSRNKTVVHAFHPFNLQSGIPSRWWSYDTHDSSFPGFLPTNTAACSFFLFFYVRESGWERYSDTCHVVRRVLSSLHWFLEYCRSILWTPTHKIVFLAVMRKQVIHWHAHFQCLSFVRIEVLWTSFDLVFTFFHWPQFICHSSVF